MQAGLASPSVVALDGAALHSLREGAAMSPTERRRRVERAALEGLSARQNGRPVSANPYRDRQRQSEREAWADGWLREDAARRAGR